MDSTLEYGVPTLKTPLHKRVNFRMIGFVTIMAIPFIWFAAIFVRQSLGHGILQGKNFAKVDLKALGNFAFDKESGTEASIPTYYRALDGHRVQLEGFMWAGRTAAPRVRDFEFVYNITKCCFGGPPLVQERVFVHLPEGRTMPYVFDFIRLTGVLHVKVRRAEDGTVVEIYTLDVDHAEPVT